VHNEYPFAFSDMPVMRYSLRTVFLGGPHISFLGLIKRSYHGWLNMTTSSEGLLFSLASGPLTVSPPLRGTNSCWYFD